MQSAGWNQFVYHSLSVYIIRVTLGSKLPAFSASRQQDAAAEGRRGDVASKHYSGVRPQRRKAIMRVIPQREPGGELYVRPGTSALLSDSLHNICPTGQNLGEGRITLASPTTNSGGRPPPRCLRLWLQLRYTIIYNMKISTSL